MVQHFFLTLLLCFVAFCTAASAQDNPDSPMGPPPSGQAPMGPPPGGFRNHKTQGTASPNGLKITSSTLSMRDKTFASDSADENAVQALGGTLYLTDCTLLKRGGDSDDEDGSSFYGTNAALAAYDGSTVCLSGGRIETSAKRRQCHRRKRRNRQRGRHYDELHRPTLARHPRHQRRHHQCPQPHHPNCRRQLQRHRNRPRRRHRHRGRRQLQLLRQRLRRALFHRRHPSHPHHRRIRQRRSGRHRRRQLHHHRRLRPHQRLCQPAAS